MPCISYSEIEDKLFEFGHLPGGGTAPSNVVRHRMSSGENFAFKKITHVAQEGFTVQNMAYIQVFIDYLQSKDPHTLKYFEECGVNLPRKKIKTVWTRTLL